MNKYINDAIVRANNPGKISNRSIWYCCNGSTTDNPSSCPEPGYWSQPVNYYDCPCLPPDGTCCCENKFYSNTWGHITFWDMMYDGSYNLGDECPFSGCCGGTCDSGALPCSQCVDPADTIIPSVGAGDSTNKCYVYGGNWYMAEHTPVEMNNLFIEQLQLCGVVLPPQGFDYCLDQVGVDDCTSPWSTNCKTLCSTACAQYDDIDGNPCMANGIGSYCREGGTCHCNCAPHHQGILGRWDYSQ